MYQQDIEKLIGNEPSSVSVCSMLATTQEFQMNIQITRFLPTRFFTLLTAVTVGTLFMMTTVGSSAFAQSGNANPQVQA